MAKQLHKDFHDSIELARVDYFDHARPCDDYFHLRQKGNKISNKCRDLSLQGGVWTKTHYDIIMVSLETLRHAPSIDLHHFLVEAFLCRLLFVAETEVHPRHTV